MDISEEKRIADATAKEIAELESLKKKGYVMVPYEELVSLICDSQNFKVIMATYQRCNNVSELEPVLKGLGGIPLKLVLRKISEQEIEDLKMKEKQFLEPHVKIDFKKGDAE